MNKNKVTKKRLAVAAAQAQLLAEQGGEIVKQLLLERVAYDSVVDSLITYCEGLRAGTVIISPSVPDQFGDIYNHRMKRLQV